MVLIEPRTLHTLVTDVGVSLALGAYRQDCLPFYRSEPSGRISTMMIHRSPGPLHDYLQAWKRQWNLVDLWLDVLAAETLISHGLSYEHHIVPYPRFVTVSSSAIIDAMKKALPRKAEPRFSDLPLLSGRDPDGRPKNVWNPFQQPRAEAKRQIMAAFESAVDAMLDQIEEPWVNGEYRPTIVKRHPEHFDWVVHYQVLGKSYGGIHKSLAPSTSRQGIAKAIKDTASLIRLTLRQPNRPGAPRRTGATRTSDRPASRPH
jgi:hypothetical protein